MEDTKKKVTIKDVARIAEVSIGTVDRVLHNRGEVSEKSKERILKVIDEIGYKPNIYASMLASNKHFTIYCVVPRMLEGEYWGLARNGIARAIEENKHHHISIQVLEFDQFDVKSFTCTCEELLSREIDAVVLTPVYRDESLALVRKLKERGVPYIYIDSKPEDEEYLAYYGMPMYESGLLAGALLAGNGALEDVACIGIERRSSPADNATLRRKEGFIDYLSRHSPGTRVYNELIYPYDAGLNTRILDLFFDRHPGVRHVVTFNSRIYLIADYLEKSGREGYSLLGFDMLEWNVNALKKGYIRYLIAQHTETQLLQSINSLVNALVFNTVPELRDNYMPMDVVIRENVDFYRDIQSQQRRS